jgi:hypothetical protein
MTDELGVPGTCPYPPAAERKAEAWVAAASPQEGVGSRHHTVPAFYLRYFADSEQLLVRRIPEHLPMVCNLRDLAQKDFYTVITDDPDGGPPRPDGRIEQVLRTVEGNAATVLSRGQWGQCVGQEGGDPARRGLRVGRRAGRAVPPRDLAEGPGDARASTKAQPPTERREARSKDRASRESPRPPACPARATYRTE